MANASQHASRQVPQWDPRRVSERASRRGPQRNSPQGRASALDAVSLRDVLAVVGFACLLATMLLYSAAAMPFQRFATLPSFVGVFSAELRTAAAVGLAVAVVAAVPRMRGLLRAPALAVAGGALYLVGDAWFCLLALGVVEPAALFAAGACIGVGSVVQCLAWGRVLAAYDLRRALAVVAASAVGAALAGWVQLALPEVPATVLFMLCAALCVALPFALGAVRPDDVGPAGGAAGGGAGAGEGASAGAGAGAGEGAAAGDSGGGAGGVDSGSGRKAPSLVRTFLDVALVPAVGLILFAILMGVRGELFFEDYPHYVAVQVAVALILFVMVLLPTKRPLLQAIYRGLVPTLAVAVLVFNYLCEALFGGSTVGIVLVMLLYTAAALLALATLAGMAHAAEFSADFIAALAVGVFSLVTVATQQLDDFVGLSDEGVRVLIVVTSALYAGGMVVFTIWRGLKGGEDEQIAAVPGAGFAVEGRSGVGIARDGIDALGPSLEERCDELAARYGLTGREREILGYLAEGHTGTYIGDELLISPNTVRTHIHNIYRKIGVATREDILRLVRG